MTTDVDAEERGRQLTLKQITAGLFGGEIAGPGETIGDGVIELIQRVSQKFDEVTDAAGESGSELGQLREAIRVLVQDWSEEAALETPCEEVYRECAAELKRLLETVWDAEGGRPINPDPLEQWRDTSTKRVVISEFTGYVVNHHDTCVNNYNRQVEGGFSESVECTCDQVPSVAELNSLLEV